MLYKKTIVSSFNEDAKKFLDRNGILLDSLETMPDEEREIVESFEVDSIVETISIYRESVKKDVCIADILGYDFPFSKDIFESLSAFFDSFGDGYHSRSVGMLEYSSDEVLSKLERSFVLEPMRLKEIKENKYFIDSNGMHRFTVLKIHYLLEKHRGKEEMMLRKKYMIPVVSKKLDLVKTYCAYLIHLIDDTILISNALDDNYRNTGNALVSDLEGNKRVLTDQELVSYTMEVIVQNGVNVANLIKLSNMIEKNFSFYEFLKTYFSELANEIERFKVYKAKRSTPWDVYDFECYFNKKEETHLWNL